MGGGTTEFKANTKIKNVIQTNVNNDHFEGHGAVMRMDVAEWFIKNFSRRNDLILDPFMGMGTTAIACINNGRDYIGYEITEKYYRDSLERIKQETSQIRFQW